MNQPNESHQHYLLIGQYGGRSIRTLFILILSLHFITNSRVSPLHAKTLERDSMSKTGSHSEANSNVTSDAKKPSKVQQNRATRQQKKRRRKNGSQMIPERQAEEGFRSRWSFGSQPYGYDHLGYPDPYFCFPYSLDPWERGSFRAPDLLDDPYFYDRVPISSIQRHRNLQANPLGGKIVPDLVQAGEALENNEAIKESVEDRKLTAENLKILGTLERASSTLANQLLRYPNGEHWVKYLQPNMLPIMATKGQYSTLNQLLSRYDQTFVKPEVQNVSAIEGFEQSRKQLRRFLQSIQ